MIIIWLAVGASLALTAVFARIWYKANLMERAMRAAQESGLALDEAGNVDAEVTLARMLQTQQETGEQFTGKRGRFLELMRIVSEGPKSLEEMYFVFDEGLDMIVRPDGVVYVPCIENEHLSIDGEIDLIEKDIDKFIERGLFEKGAGRI